MGVPGSSIFFFYTIWLVFTNTERDRVISVAPDSSRVVSVPAVVVVSNRGEVLLHGWPHLTSLAAF